jgi:myo-inositol-1-phosphate synthase
MVPSLTGLLLNLVKFVSLCTFRGVEGYFLKVCLFRVAEMMVQVLEEQDFRVPSKIDGPLLCQSVAVPDYF